MPHEVQIKQFELSELEAVLSFLRVAYANEPRKSDPAFWKWHYLENPHISPDNIPLWIVKSGDRVVGQMATIPGTLKVGNEEKRALWIIDFIILPEHRGQGLGKRLVQAARDTYCETLMELGHNEQSGAVFRSLDWVPLGDIHRYHQLLFPGNAAKEISRLAPIRYLVNLVYAPFRPGSTSLASAGGDALREVTQFDSSFDELWRQASVQWPCAILRSSRFLEWLFIKQPGKKFDVLGYYEGNRLLGYVVLFFRRSERSSAPAKATISDLCYSAKNSQTVIKALLKGALRLAIERRAGGLVIDILDSSVEQELSKLGFWRIKASPKFMIYSPTHQELMYQPQNWFLTRADADISVFEEPNIQDYLPPLFPE